MSYAVHIYVQEQVNNLSRAFQLKLYTIGNLNTENQTLFSKQYLEAEVSIVKSVVIAFVTIITVTVVVFISSGCLLELV